MSREIDACAAAIRPGSHSFHAASRLLPTWVRDDATVLHAFCRAADDAGDARADAAAELRARLARIYAGRPFAAPVDRAFAAVVDSRGLPRALPEALLKLRAYEARVAGSVGAMMAVLMDRRDADVLARACDLGVAMQLTNIARDVREDARACRLYLRWRCCAGPASGRRPCWPGRTSGRNS